MKLKLDRKWLLIIIAIASQIAILSSGQPQATLANEQLTNTCSGQNTQGRTVQEIGLQNYRNYLVRANQELAAISPSEPISFPLSLDCPIRFETTPRNNRRNPASPFRVIGYLDVETGNIQPITPRELINIFQKYLQELPQSSRSDSRTASTVPAANPRFSEETQQPTLPAISLVVLNTQDNQPYFLPNVQFSTVFKDALNATLTKSLMKSDFELTSLDINRLIQLPMSDVSEI